MKALVGHLFAGESPNAAGRAGPVTAPGPRHRRMARQGPGSRPRSTRTARPPASAAGAPLVREIVG